MILHIRRQSSGCRSSWSATADVRRRRATTASPARPNASPAPVDVVAFNQALQQIVRVTRAGARQTPREPAGVAAPSPLPESAFARSRTSLSATDGERIRLTSAENRLLSHLAVEPVGGADAHRARRGALRPASAGDRPGDRCRGQPAAQQARSDWRLDARFDKDRVPPRISFRQRRFGRTVRPPARHSRDRRRRRYRSPRHGRRLAARARRATIRGQIMADPCRRRPGFQPARRIERRRATSLLGSLVIVARHRGVQLTVPQLIHDHLLQPEPLSVAKLLTIAKASACAPTRPACTGAIWPSWARRCRRSCCCATAARWCCARSSRRRRAAARRPAGPERQRGRAADPRRSAVHRGVDRRGHPGQARLPAARRGSAVRAAG